MAWPKKEKETQRQCPHWPRAPSIHDNFGGRPWGSLIKSLCNFISGYSFPVATLKSGCVDVPVFDGTQPPTWPLRGWLSSSLLWTSISCLQNGNSQTHPLLGWSNNTMLRKAWHILATHCSINPSLETTWLYFEADILTLQGLHLIYEFHSPCHPKYQIIRALSVLLGRNPYSHLLLKRGPRISSSRQEEKSLMQNGKQCMVSFI